MPNLLQLSAPTIDDLRQKVRDEHGPLARIVSAEKVIPRGIGRIRKPAYFEAMVELPDEPVSPPEVRVNPAARSGIAALLSDAEDAEAALELHEVRAVRTTVAESAVGSSAGSAAGGHAGNAAGGAVGSGAGNAAGGHAGNAAGGLAGVGAGGATDAAYLNASRSSAGFDELMASLGGFAAPAAPPADPVPLFAAPLALEAGHPPLLVPVPPRVPGDLVVVVSLGQDAVPVAQAMAKVFAPGDLRTGGTIKPRGRTASALTDRRAALLARAEGVERGSVVFCAFGVEAGDDPLHTLAAIDPDQVWIVVDAGRKPEDTRRWVDRIARTVDIAAVAVVGAASTATPHTVNALGLPIGWVDGAPAPAARL